MRKIFFGAAVLLAVAFFTGCRKGHSEAEIIFGVSYGECLGDCNILYRLSQTAIFPDNCDECTHKKERFKKTPLPQASFELAKPLLEKIPGKLLSKPTTKFGCPGCDDGGAYQLQFSEDGADFRIIWDRHYIDVPEEIKPYLEQVVKVIEELK